MVVNCAAYKGGCRVADIDLGQAGPVETGDGRFVWIGLHEPDADLLRTVQKRFCLHDLAIEDAHSAHQRPKLEIYGDSLFLVLRTAQLQEGTIQFGETHVFAGRGYVVTVRHGSTTAYTEVRARCESAPKMLAMGESFVVYSIMDFIVDHYFPIVHELEGEVDKLEDAIFSRTSNQPRIARIYELRHELLLLRRAVPAAAGSVQSDDAFRRAADRSGHVSVFPRRAGPRHPPGGEHRQPARPVGRGPGSEPSAGVARAEQHHQDLFRRRGGADAADAGRLGLRHEFQEHA
jgi:hypothetical protein